MIETERLKFRRLTEDDFDILFDLRKDPDVSKYLGGVPTREKIERRLAWQVNNHATLGIGMCVMLFKPDGDKVVGFSGIQPLEDTGEIEVGYTIAKSHWGMGIGSEACRAWLDYGFNQYGLERIVAVCDPENFGSYHIMEKCGMTYENNVRAYESDCKMYAISKDEFNSQREA